MDTGPRAGHRFIDELYAPKVVSIIDAIIAAGLDDREVAARLRTLDPDRAHLSHDATTYRPI